jgi:hypothetical protein
MPLALYLPPLLLTLASEVPLAAALSTRALRARTATDALLLNLCTNPPTVFSHLSLVAVGVPWQGSFALVEIVVLLTESLGYRLVTRLPWSRAFVLAAVCNGVSAALSPLLSFIL